VHSNAKLSSLITNRGLWLNALEDKNVSFVRVHAIIKGLVQGVFFRRTTVLVAQNLGVTGWVRNNPDGSVEVVAEGPREKINELLAFFRRGPEHAEVREVNVNYEEPTHEFKNFTRQN